MKSFFDYDVNSPQERQERFEHYPELSKFYIALSEELSPEECEKFYEAEKQSYYSFVKKESSLKPSQSQLKWIQ